MHADSYRHQTQHAPSLHNLQCNKKMIDAVRFLFLTDAAIKVLASCPLRLHLGKVASQKVTLVSSEQRRPILFSPVQVPFIGKGQLEKPNKNRMIAVNVLLAIFLLPQVVFGAFLLKPLFG